MIDQQRANEIVDMLTQPHEDNLSELLSDLGQEKVEDPQELSLLRTAEQLAWGWLSGFTALPIGDQPHNTVEGIARSIGHLGGFIGVTPISFSSNTVPIVSFSTLRLSSVILSNFLNMFNATVHTDGPFDVSGTALAISCNSGLLNISAKNSASLVKA